MRRSAGLAVFRELRHSIRRAHLSADFLRAAERTVWSFLAYDSEGRDVLGLFTLHWLLRHRPAGALGPTPQPRAANRILERVLEDELDNNEDFMDELVAADGEFTLRDLQRARGVASMLSRRDVIFYFLDMHQEHNRNFGRRQELEAFLTMPDSPRGANRRRR